MLTKKFQVHSETIARVSLGGGGVCFSNEPVAALRVNCFLSRYTVARGLRLDVTVRSDAKGEVYAKRSEPFSVQAYTHGIPVRRLREGWYGVHVSVRGPGAEKPLTEADLVLRKVPGPFDR